MHINHMYETMYFYIGKHAHIKGRISREKL